MHLKYNNSIFEGEKKGHPILDKPSKNVDTNEREALVAVETGMKVNTFDGCTACGCQVIDDLTQGEEHSFWTSFGLVKIDAQEGWLPDNYSTRCGVGFFDEVQSNFNRTIGIPYLIVDLSASALVPSNGVSLVKAHLRVQTFSGFNEKGGPVYVGTTEDRMLDLSTNGTIIIPFSVADKFENKTFGVHEVYLRVQAALTGKEVSSYGVISVWADVPGAEVLLDGGFVGRIIQDNPLVIKNVPVGARNVQVRDFSGRKSVKNVVVEKGKAVEITFDVLGLPAVELEKGLVPIGKNPEGYEEFWRTKDDVIVVKIPEGDFLMGSKVGVGESNERPQHRVYVSDFLIDKTEVTYRQFKAFVDATESSLPKEPIWGYLDDYPVSFVAFNDATAYCEWVGGRLPTEAEWEKAARGTDGRIYPWGNEWEADRCNTISGGMHRPESAGSYESCISPYGVLEMAGSSWEWCSDWYGESYYSESPSRNPKGPASGTRRVMRGGGWMSQPLWVRTAYRFSMVPSSTSLHSNHGFRCAQDLTE